VQDGAEILIDTPMAKRGHRMLQALADTKPAGSIVTTRFAGTHRLLVLYGVGLPWKYTAFRAHRARGGHVACWDLGYWDREEAMRVSIDALHPSAAQLDLAPAGESRCSIDLRADARPDGPVLLIGMGIKSVCLYGLRPFEWERGSDGDRHRFPGRRDPLAPEGRKPTPLVGTTLCHGTPIEDALRGCSLVVCRHSNVAVDACVAGVPVECEDGAARALYRGNPRADPRAARRVPAPAHLVGVVALRGGGCVGLDSKGGGLMSDTTKRPLPYDTRCLEVAARCLNPAYPNLERPWGLFQLARGSGAARRREAGPQDRARTFGCRVSCPVRGRS
jgi:hypothetical protein